MSSWQGNISVMCHFLAMDGLESELASIVSSLDMLRQIALKSPDHAQRLTQELQRLCERYQSPPRKGPRFGATEHGSEERREAAGKYKSTRAWRELQKILGPTIRIPDARRVADVLSKNSLIPLSPEVRNHCDRLMGWFEANWEALAPGLVSLTSMRKIS
jgi:plasmid stabilization system protein ParE